MEQPQLNERPEAQEEPTPAAHEMPSVQRLKVRSLKRLSNLEGLAAYNGNRDQCSCVSP